MTRQSSLDISNVIASAEVADISKRLSIYCARIKDVPAPTLGTEYWAEKGKYSSDSSPSVAKLLSV